MPICTIDIHSRTLAAVRAADFEQIDVVMDEHLAQLEQIWERETGRGLVPARCPTSCSRSPSARARCAPASASSPDMRR